jgi:hypothetical protein
LSICVYYLNHVLAARGDKIQVLLRSVFMATGAGGLVA